MEGLPEVQRWKAMTEAFLDPTYGVVGGGALIREGLVMERLQEMLVSLSTLLQKLDRVLPAEDSYPSARGGAPPHAHDGALLLAPVLLAALSLAGLLYFFFFRAGGGEAAGGVGGGGGWGPAKGATKWPRGEGTGLLSMSEHEWMFVSIGTLILAMICLGGFYYYYCYQAGCFGGGGGGRHIAPMVGPAGRKLRVLSG